jgi:hypothetical protein
MNSVVIIIPAGNLALGNQIGEAMGYGPASYTVPLSADGLEPATHYGLHTWASDAFVALLNAGTVSPLPDGVTEQNISDLVAAMDWTASASDANPAQHFAEDLVTLGLERVI